MPDPAQQAKVERYASWMRQNPFTVLGHKMEQQSRFAHELKEAWKLRDRDKKREIGKDRSEWDLFDQRTTSGMKDTLLKGKKK
jgi:hypothetical protein